MAGNDAVLVEEILHDRILQSYSSNDLGGSVLEQGFAAMRGEPGIFNGHAGRHDHPAERAGMESLPCAARGAWIAERGSRRLPPARILAQVL